ncbi:MAG: hypothetical protein WAT79_08960 [Saprospiraceae bacterium]
MVYNIKYNDHMIHESFMKGSVVKKAKDGSDVPVKEFEGHTIPGTATVIRILKDQNNVPCVGITEENLKKVVPTFALYDSDKKERIVSANPTLGIDPFWNHPDLNYEISNFGQQIVVDDYDKTPKTAFWMDVFKEDPRFWINDGKTERPESLREVMFIITPENHEVKPVITKDFSEDAYKMFTSLTNMPRLNKQFIIDELGDNLYDPIDTPDDELNILIIRGVSTEGDKRVYTGDTFRDFVTDVSKYDPRRLNLSKAIRLASKNDVIKYLGDNFYFQTFSMGNSLKKVEEFLNNPTNKKITGAIFGELKTRGLPFD